MSEVDKLRACLREVVALTALPALWSGSTPEYIARSLAEILYDSLDLKWVYVDLNGKKPPICVLYTKQGIASAQELEKFTSAAAPTADMWWENLNDPTINLKLKILDMPIGVSGQHGVLRAACRRSDFPTETERMLLRIAVNQMAIVLERSEIESALKHSEQRYRHFFDTAPVAIWEEDFAPVLAALDALRQDGVTDVGQYIDDHPEFVQMAARLVTILDANDAAVKMFQAKEKTEFLTSLDRFLLPESLPVFKDYLKSIVQGHTYCQAETLRCTLNGEVLQVLTTLTWSPDSKRTLVTLTDITQRKKMEEELIKAQKLESIGFLAGGIAHDFNNILTAIFGNVALAKMHTQTGTAVSSSLEEAEKAFWRARALTQQLLTFAKGGAPIKSLGSLAPILYDAATLTLSGSNIQYDLEIDPGLCASEFDAGQMGQVFSNLLLNAKQAMPHGGKIKIQACSLQLETGGVSSLPSGLYVQVKISDQGIGIPPKHLQKVFDPYFTTKQQGSGLGLAIVYSIVKRHAGHIEVASRVHHGTTFTIYLPAALAVMLIDSPPSDVICGSGRILMMDDDDAARHVGAQLLEQLGYQVDQARNGEEAITLYHDALTSGRLFDAVILDLTVIGGMGGKACFHELRERDPAIKAIVSSGYSNDPLVANFLNHGFHGAVVKPYQLRELSRTVYAVAKAAARKEALTEEQWALGSK